MENPTELKKLQSGEIITFIFVSNSYSIEVSDHLDPTNNRLLKPDCRYTSDTRQELSDLSFAVSITFCHSFSLLKRAVWKKDD